MRKLTVDEFRYEVQDKLGVVFNGCHSSPLSRALHRKQAEDFLVELYAEAIEPAPKLPMMCFYCCAPILDIGTSYAGSPVHIGCYHELVDDNGNKR